MKDMAANLAAVGRRKQATIISFESVSVSGCVCSLHSTLSCWVSDHFPGAIGPSR